MFYTSDSSCLHCVGTAAEPIACSAGCANQVLVCERLQWDETTLYRDSTLYRGGGKRKPNKHKQLRGELSRGKTETHKQNSQEITGKGRDSRERIPGQPRESFVYAFLWFSVFFFFPRPYFSFSENFEMPYFPKALPYKWEEHSTTYGRSSVIELGGVMQRKSKDWSAFPIRQRPQEDKYCSNMWRCIAVVSGDARPRQGTDICNFRAPSPLDFLNFLQWFFSSFSRFSV